MNNNKWILTILYFIVKIILILISGFILKILWNCSIAEMFESVPELTYNWAVCIIMCVRIILKDFINIDINNKK